ncbi:F0F1 ATP synthase subunit B [Gynuella sp.]|uniref:F0F1 ATP synthase subunit B n=1 Tax=Gynuella sp. TaxID=2969146 RepID=UPI003D11D9B8
MNINLTLIGQLLSFAVFVWFCAKFVWPPLVKAMDARQAKIAEGLNAADRAAKDLELAQERAAQQLREAKEQAATIVDQANKRSAQIVAEAQKEAQQEAERIRKSAEAEIEQEAIRAREELRQRVSELALSGAQKILQSSVDAKKHSELLEKLAAEL